MRNQLGTFRRRVDADERSAAVTTLDVSSVSKHFGGVYALRDVSLTCRSGEIVGLIGPNGAGKTTLLNVISSAFPLALDERLPAPGSARSQEFISEHPPSAA